MSLAPKLKEIWEFCYTNRYYPTNDVVIQFPICNMIFTKNVYITVKPENIIFILDNVTNPDNYILQIFCRNNGSDSTFQIADGLRLYTCYQPWNLGSAQLVKTLYFGGKRVTMDNAFLSFEADYVPPNYNAWEKTILISKSEYYIIF